MDKIIIQGGQRLKGKVKISGSKNAALPLMGAAILGNGIITLKNIPQLADIRTMIKLLKGFGIKVKEGLTSIKIDARKVTKTEAPYDLVRTMRASILVLGPLLARTGQAKVSLPGGCAIGARPVDRHLKALEEMGATIKLEQGYILAKCKKLKGAKIVFEEVTVTGTENIMMAACLAEGTTIIENAAREPEVIDLARLLNSMGAHITGEGTDRICIEGVDSMGGAEHSVMPDRIEAGTFMIAAAMTQGDVLVCGAQREYLSALVHKLEDAGVFISDEKDGLRVKGPKSIKSVDVITQPYPGFATDFQAQFMALMSIAEGSSLITENIFENRFMHMAELNRMGADIKMEGKMAIVRGVSHLAGAPVMATDLRASACLVLAGLVCSDVTEIHRVYHIDRGYERIEKKLRKLGAKIRRAKVKY